MARGKRARAGSAPSGAPRLPFNPTVSFGEGEVVINLPELSLIGVGADFDAAKADLIDELHAYAEQFRASVLLSRASNRVNHEAHLQWLEAAEAEGQLEELLFAAPGDKLPPRPDDEGRAYTRLIGDNVTFGPIKGNDLFQRRHQDEQERQARS